MRRIILEISDETLSGCSEIVLRLNEAQALAESTSTTALPQPSIPAAADARHGFVAFIEDEAARCSTEGRARTAETYRASAASLMRFLQGSDLALEAVDATLLKRYADYLRTCRLMPNTVSFYLRRLHALYMRAVASGLCADARPFEGVSLHRVRTSKRALAAADLRRLASFDVGDAMQREARDLFLFSFFTRGMAFVDMAHLTRDNVANGLLSYRRHKTGQLLRIRWLPCMQQIVDRYNFGAHHLLPLIPDDCADELLAYRASQRRTARHLQVLGARLGIPNLTMYVARHSWATIAQTLNVPTAVISAGMGHESERTTRIYLAQIDADRVDAANERVLSTLFGAEVSISRGGD